MAISIENSLITERWQIDPTHKLDFAQVHDALFSLKRQIDNYDFLGRCSLALISKVGVVSDPVANCLVNKLVISRNIYRVFFSLDAAFFVRGEKVTLFWVNTSTDEHLALRIVTQLNKCCIIEANFGLQV